MSQTDDHPQRPKTPTPMSPLAASAWLTVAMAFAFPAFAFFGFSQHGQTGVLAAAVAGAICWGAGLMALLCVALLRQPEMLMNALGLAMIVRMSIPMGAGLLLAKLGGPLVEAGVFGMIVGFYLIGLLVETLLAIRLTASSKDEQVSKAV
jgi:hypothetical protein